MKQTPWMILAIIFIAFCFPAAASGPVPAAEAWTLEKAAALLAESDLSRGSGSGLEWDIDIETRSGKKTDHTALTVLVDGTASLAVFQSPPRAKGQKLLMKDRNMWFIKPGLSRPVPISPRQKLLGGASNGDIASTNYAGDYTIASFSEELLKEVPCILLDLRAAGRNATYDRIRYWISTRTRTGIQAEFFTVSGKLFKIARFEYGHQVILNGRQRPFVSRMIIASALADDEITVMDYHRIRHKDIPASAFNLDLLVE